MGTDRSIPKGRGVGNSETAPGAPPRVDQTLEGVRCGRGMGIHATRPAPGPRGCPARGPAGALAGPRARSSGTGRGRPGPPRSPRGADRDGGNGRAPGSRAPLHRDGPGAVLEQVAVGAMVPGEGAGGAPQEGAHDPGQGARARADEERAVVGQGRPGIHRQRPRLHPCRRPPDEVRPVCWRVDEAPDRVLDVPPSGVRRAAGTLLSREAPRRASRRILQPGRRSSRSTQPPRPGRRHWPRPRGFASDHSIPGGVRPDPRFDTARPDHPWFPPTGRAGARTPSTTASGGWRGRRKGPRDRSARRAERREVP